MKRSLTVLIAALLLMSAACKKKEETPQPTPQQGAVPQGPIVDSPMQSPPPGHGTGGPKIEFQVVVPQEVTDQWSGVKFTIEDRVQNKKQDISAAIGSEVKIPDSGLVIKVGPFLPDFKMTGDTISSSSNELINPAVGVVIFENGTKIFPATGQWGWLYMKFPTIHSFQHERFAIALKEGVKK